MVYENWRNEVVSLVGQEKGDFIKNSLYVTSTGSNDWDNNYYLNPILMEFTPEEHTTFLIGKARSFIRVHQIPTKSTPFQIGFWVRFW